MDNGLAKNDPYRKMDSAQDSVRPDFLGKSDKNDKDNARRAAGENLREAESNAGGFYKPDGNNEDVKKSENQPAGFFTGKGKSLMGGGKSKFKIAKASAAVMVLFMVLIAVVAVGVIGNPLFMIGNLDYNLQDAGGFTGTTRILEKQAGYITEEDMALGRIPDTLAGDFAAHGLMFGQVTESGDFVRTNQYIADIDKLKDMAVLGHFQANPSNGELALLFKDKIIEAADFVATLNSTPELYAAFSEALDISAKYYYSSEADTVFQDAGLSRGRFTEWKDTGDSEENKESFNEMMQDALDSTSDINVAGVLTEGDSTTATPVQVTSGDDAYSIIQSVADDTTGDNATSKAAQLLNSAISANEPYLAANSFMAIEEPIQRARIEGNGPVNEVMNFLNVEKEIQYTDVKTGEEKTTKNAILTTGNFVAAVSAGEYSLNEAANFSRDRGLTAIGMSDSSIITDTAVATNGQKKSAIAIPINFGESANADTLGVLGDSVDQAVVQSNYDLMQSIVGGNRIVEGGAFLSNSINSNLVGSMPADASAIAAYHREVKEAMALKAEADRATKNPFDITSPYTFMGSLVRKVGNLAVQSRASGQSVPSSVVGTVAGLAKNSVDSLWNSAVADGDDKSYAMTFGDYCETVQSVGAEGDIYCTSHDVISTGYMKKTAAEWESDLLSRGDIDESGAVTNNEGGLKDFMTLAMGRKATVGVKSSEVCEAWKEMHASGLQKIMDALSNFVGLYESCNGVDFDVATGAASVIGEGSDDARFYGGYSLYDRVASLMGNSVSRVSTYRKQYLAEHPQDNSPAGIIARRSGMTKDEAKLALAYADYLNVVARYNPAERYAFGREAVKIQPVGQLFKQAEKVAMNWYAVWHGKAEYDDLRGRVLVV